MRDGSVILSSGPSQSNGSSGGTGGEACGISGDEMREGEGGSKGGRLAGKPGRETDVDW